LLKGGSTVFTESEPLDTAPRRDALAVIARCAHELELCAELLQPDDLPDAAPFVERAADAVRRLEALLDYSSDGQKLQVL
jgi:flagellin-specific chaperone FliS